MAGVHCCLTSPLHKLKVVKLRASPDWFILEIREAINLELVAVRVVFGYCCFRAKPSVRPA